MRAEGPSPARPPPCRDARRPEDATGAPSPAGGHWEPRGEVATWSERPARPAATTPPAPARARPPASPSCAQGGRHCCAAASVESRLGSAPVRPGPEGAGGGRGLCPEAREGGRDSRSRERSKQDHVLFVGGGRQSRGGTPGAGGAQSGVRETPESPVGGVSCSVSAAGSAQTCFSVTRPHARLRWGPPDHFSSELLDDHWSNKSLPPTVPRLERGNDAPFYR